MCEQVQRQLSLSWGITPLMMSLAHSTDELIVLSTSLAKEHGYLHDGELAVVTAGVPVGVSGTTNMIKIHMIGNCLATGVGVGREDADLSNASGRACVCHTLDEVRAKFQARHGAGGALHQQRDAGLCPGFCRSGGGGAGPEQPCCYCRQSTAEAHHRGCYRRYRPYPGRP